MRGLHATCLLMVMLGCAGEALGQAGVVDILGASGAGRNVLTPTGASAGLAALSGPIDPAEYVVGPGDYLQINLSGGVLRDKPSIRDRSLGAPSHPRRACAPPG